MNPQHQLFLPPVSADNWNEGLARDKKFKEAVQRRAAEKKMSGEGQKLKKISAAGRLVIEP